MKFVGLLLSSLVSFPAVFGDSETYCDDAYECEGETINTTSTYCLGYYSCDDTTIESSYHFNYGAYASYEADIDVYTSLTYGYRACYDADVAVKTMYTFGFQSGIYADIEPYSSSLTLYLYGYYAGYDSDVFCYSGDSCKIYCGDSYGCYGLKYYCYSGATCYYDCDGDDVCPTFYSGVSSMLINEGKAIPSNIFTDMKDEEINNKKEENKFNKNKKIQKEKETGKMDEELYLGTLKLAKERGELDNIPKEFFEGLSVMPHQNENIFEQIKYSGYESIIYGFIGVLLFGISLIISKQCNYLMNGKDEYKYVPIV